MSGEISFGLCCCSCRALSNVLLIEARLNDFCLLPSVEDTHFLQGASVLKLGDIPANIDVHDIIYLSIQVDPGIGTPPPLVTLSAGQKTMFAEWFARGCKRLVIIGEQGTFSTQIADRNVLLSLLGSSMQIVPATMDSVGGPGGVAGTMEPSSPFAAGVTEIRHEGTSYVTGGSPVAYTSDTASGSIRAFVASERVDRSSVVVVSDSDILRYSPFSGFDLSLLNLNFIGNLLSVSVDDA